MTLFLGGVDLARRRDVGRFHLKVRLEVYPESFFFFEGGKGGSVKGWTNEFYKARGRLPVSMFELNPEGI